MAFPGSNRIVTTLGVHLWHAGAAVLVLCILAGWPMGYLCRERVVCVGLDEGVVDLLDCAGAQRLRGRGGRMGRVCVEGEGLSLGLALWNDLMLIFFDINGGPKNQHRPLSSIVSTPLLGGQCRPAPATSVEPPVASRQHPDITPHPVLGWFFLKRV